ncbi:MAG: M28 family metallopeptidase [Spirosoma sp.]|nr:M28 family metallopeptidase [Spirosoma sp.]
MHHRYLFLPLLAATFLSPPATAQSPIPEKPLLGFGPAQATAEYKREGQFDSYLKPANLRDWMKRLSARPHHVGSPYDRENAQFMVSLFKSWGYDTRIDTSFVLFPTPKLRLLELVAPTKFKAGLTEAPVKGDPVSAQTGEQLPPYNAFSGDGDVTAELVFVNYGIPADYEELERRGIDVKGKIVIAKYGGSWRGIKPKVAAEHGAIGCLIYSDPKDDGYAQGDAYPKGAFKNETMVQRGSVLDMPVYPGDPLTPGYGATKDAKRLDYKAAPTVMKIPVQPISYSDALPLLSALGGPMAPATWRGGLPISYRLGPGPARVHLKLAFNWTVEPVYNVIAVMKGSEYPDQWIVRGNHHDAWVNGANDPVSGMIAVLEEARALSELAKTGWKPKRTIVFAGWDGEEPGLLGSTEWVETNETLLKKNVVAYLNTDSNARGFLGAGGSHTLEKFFNEVSRDVKDPETGVSVQERRRALQLVSGPPDVQAEARDRADLRIEPLGSGSDYTSFLQHAGIAAMNVGFGGEGSGGEYHSAYDSYDHYIRFKDPDFAYGIALAQVMGRCVMRLADADVLPFSFQSFANTVTKYAGEVKKLAETMRTETDRQNKLIQDKRYVLVADPTETMLPPKVQPAVPHLNFAPLENALTTLDKSVRAYDGVSNRLASLSSSQLEELNRTLYQTERYLLSDEGLPRRSWFRHQIYAPGFYTGYGVKTLPGIREAIEERKWDEASEQIQRVAKTLNGFSAQIDKASAMVPAVSAK